jgi:hypothetical protein
MKKLVLALTVLAFCSVSFAGTPGQREADANPQTDTAAQESIAQTTSISPNATTACSYTFTSSGSNNSYLNYCVTANGNIPQIETPFGYTQISGRGGEGYGICNESPAQNYTDYAISDTGNWAPASLVSKTATSVKIARSTSDGNWTLTQTITQAKPSSITIVMALTNNQAVSKVAYLVRYGDVNADGWADNILFAGLNSAVASSYSLNGYPHPPYYGFQLQNVGTPQFGYWQAFAQTVPSGPNACAFAFNDSFGFFQGDGSVVIAYAGPVPAHGTKTVTLSYRGG